MMSKRGRLMLTPYFGMLLLGCWVALIDHRHDFVFDLLEVEAFALPKSSSPSFRFPKSSFLVSQTQAQSQTETELRSTSASATYLESISYRPPTVEDGLLGVTSKYLDALSSVSDQLYTTNDYAQAQYYAYASEATTTAEETTTQLQMQASIPPGSTAHVPFSEDQLVNEVVQRVTQEFSSALEAFGGDTYDSFFNSASTLLADSTPAYIWDLEETPKKGSRALRESIQNGVDSSRANSDTTSPDETLRVLTTKLDNTFRSFKENLSSSTHSVTNSVAGSFRSQTAQPNAAMTAAKQQENIVNVKQKFDQGALTPEALSANAKEAVDMASSVANKAMVDLESASSSISPFEMEKHATATSSAFQRSLSETATSANAAIGGVTSKASSAFGSLVTNTNQGIEKALSTVAKTTTAATSSIAETTNAATSSIFETTNAATSSAIGSVGSLASSAAASVQNSVGAVGASTKAAVGTSAKALASGASSVAASVQNSVGAVGASTKAAVVTAQTGTSATTGKVSAVALSASQGFGLPGNAYTGGGDVAGMIEMTVATILSIPRALMDTTMMETNPNGMDDLMEGISGSLYNDVLMPLSEPLQSIAATSTNAATTMASTMANTAAATPLDQAQAVLKTLQMVLALVVGIPRAALEGLTGLTIGEIQVAISQTDVRALSEQLTGFASAVSTVLVSLLKVVAEAVSVIVTNTGVGSAIATGQEEVVSKLVSFVVEDLLPAILDGLLIILQQFAVMILEGSSYIVAAL
jgi:hypothetical protein